jgi:hypothetical protein
VVWCDFFSVKNYIFREKYSIYRIIANNNKKIFAIYIEYFQPYVKLLGNLFSNSNFRTAVSGIFFRLRHSRPCRGNAIGRFFRVADATGQNLLPRLGGEIGSLRPDAAAIPDQATNSPHRSKCKNPMTLRPAYGLRRDAGSREAAASSRTQARSLWVQIYPSLAGNPAPTSVPICRLELDAGPEQSDLIDWSRRRRTRPPSRRTDRLR